MPRVRIALPRGGWPPAGGGGGAGGGGCLWGGARRLATSRARCGHGPPSTMTSRRKPVRLEKPRVAPLADADIDPELRVRFGDGPILNIFRTLAHHPALAKRWLVFGNHVLAKSTLAPREREIAILRIGWLCRSGYEWGQHVVIARAAGLGDEEIARIAEGPEAPGRSAPQRAP